MGFPSRNFREKKNADSFYLTQKNVYSIPKFPGFFVCLVFPWIIGFTFFFKNSSFEYLVITVVFN